MNLDNISSIKEELTGTWVTFYLFIRIRHFQMCRGYYLPTQRRLDSLLISGYILPSGPA